MIIEICLSVLAMATPILVCAAYRAGMNDCRQLFGIDAQSEPQRPPKAPKTAQAVEMPPELKQVAQIWENIEAYDGTELGQKKVVI